MPDCLYNQLRVLKLWFPNDHEVQIQSLADHSDPNHSGESYLFSPRFHRGTQVFRFQVDVAFSSSFFDMPPRRDDAVRWRSEFFLKV